jgi:hypothetical protein
MQRAQKLAIRLNRAASGALWPRIHDPLAMQKAVGSNPIIRFSFEKAPLVWAFVACSCNISASGNFRRACCAEAVAPVGRITRPRLERKKTTSACWSVNQRGAPNEVTDGLPATRWLAVQDY